MNKIKLNNIKKIFALIILGFMLQIIASFLLTTVIDFFPATAAQYSQDISTLLQITPWMLFRVCVLFPVCEELIFRGAILNGLKRVVPFLVANIIQALLFGIYHGNIVQGIYAFILGLFIGYIYKTAGGLIYTCVLHMSINFMGMFLESLIPESTPLLIKTLLFILAVFISAFAVRYIENQRNTKNQDNI